MGGYACESYATESYPDFIKGTTCQFMIHRRDGRELDDVWYTLSHNNMRGFGVPRFIVVMPS